MSYNTKEDINSAPAGTQIDRVIADQLSLPTGLPYSTDISFAFSALAAAEPLLAATGVGNPFAREKGRFFLQGPHSINSWSAGWLERDGEYPLIEAEAAAAPLAMCRAILTAFLHPSAE